MSAMVKLEGMSGAAREEGCAFGREVSMRLRICSDRCLDVGSFRTMIVQWPPNVG